jgi:hypothetical protein
MDALSLPDVLQHLPLPALLAAAAVVVGLSLVILRILTNTFNGKAPPVDEGIPFVGGLIKFSKVRSRPAAAAGARERRMPTPFRAAYSCRRAQGH